MNSLSVEDLAQAGIDVLQTARDGSLNERQTVFVPRFDWVLITPPDTSFHPRFFETFSHATVRRPDVAIFYFDTVAGAGATQDLRLKPDWDSTLFMSHDYVGLPILVKAQIVQQEAGVLFRSHYASAAVFGMVLRAAAAGAVVARIEDILSHSALPCRSLARDRRQALEDWFNECKLPYYVESGLTAQALEIRRNFEVFPSVSLVIPTRQSSGEGDSVPFIRRLLDSLARTDYPMSQVHVIVGDDVEDGWAYADENWPFHLQRVVTTRGQAEPFNYAAKMNQLWRLAKTEHIVFLNDDITVQASAWLKALLSHSMLADVGGVGARLLYPDGRIQHAGMAGGVYGLCTHVWIGEPGDRPTYQDWAILAREWLMVTGATFATRRSILQEMNGFDERFTLDFNDVDLCMRMRMAGYRIVYTPHAELVHHEKGSRQSQTWPGSQLALFLKRWSHLLDTDPAFNRRLSKESHVVRPSSDVEAWWE